MAVWKQLFLLCLLAGAAYGGYQAYTVYFPPQPAGGGPSSERPVPVETARAEPRILEQSVEAVGTTRAAQSVEIVPETDGRVVALDLAPGRRVEAGAVLVRLDDTIERADLAEAEARLDEQQKELQRMQQLRRTNAVAQATLEETTARLAEAEAQLDRARQRLANRTITAPFAGIVGLSEIDLGARVSEGDAITRLDDLTEVEIEFALPETLFARIRKGLPVTAQSAAYPGRTFEGEITAMDTRIDPVSRAFRTRAVLPNPDSLLPAGMFMSLRLTLSRSQSLTVPEEAIVFQAAETYVFVVRDGTVVRVPVETGQRRDGLVAIEKGLDRGEEVVVRGLQRVRDGSQVEVIGPPAASAGDGDT